MHAQTLKLTVVMVERFVPSEHVVDEYRVLCLLITFKIDLSIGELGKQKRKK
jgi:hypothetical protein